MRFSAAFVLAALPYVLGYPSWEPAELSKRMENKKRCMSNPSGSLSASGSWSSSWSSATPTASASLTAAIAPATTAVCNDAQTPRKIGFLPAPPGLNDLKHFPDEDHPFVPPGPTDQRGPCPALNILANHGYINHTGIVTFEEVHYAVQEVFNMEFHFAGFVAGFGMLAEGNINTGQLSIGYPDERIPPYPDCIDGPISGGLANHGRFEGDISIGRQNHGVGDSVEFQDDRWDMLLRYFGMYGEDGPEGKATVATLKLFQEFKYDRFLQEQARDKHLQFHIDRQITAYSESGLVLTYFRNGMTGNVTADYIGYLFRNNTFPPNFYRRVGPGDSSVIGAVASALIEAHTIAPGQNDLDGNYVIDTPMYTDFPCEAYQGLMEKKVPAAFMNATGIFKENLDFLLEACFNPFRDQGTNCTTKFYPGGLNRPELNAQMLLS